MGSKARIVFSDGSKRMAYNNDDSLFRWHERKAAQAADILEQHSEGIAIRDCSEPSNLEQARVWEAQLVLQLALLEGQLTTLNGTFATRALYMTRTQHIRGAISEIRVQRQSLRVQFPELDRKSVHTEHMERQASRFYHESMKLRAALGNLYSTVFNSGIEASDELIAAMHVAQELLEGSPGQDGKGRA